MDRTDTEIVLGLIDAISSGNIDAVMHSLADGLERTFHGSHRVAGTMRDKDALMQGLFAVVGDMLEDGIKVTIRNIIAGGGQVVVEAEGRARSKTGLDYTNDYCLIFEVADGRVRRVRQYLDTALVTRAFGAGDAPWRHPPATRWRNPASARHRPSGHPSTPR
jgi:uncharacterized protein